MIEEVGSAPKVDEEATNAGIGAQLEVYQIFVCSVAFIKKLVFICFCLTTMIYITIKKRSVITLF